MKFSRNIRAQIRKTRQEELNILGQIRPLMTELSGKLNQESGIRHDGGERVCGEEPSARDFEEIADEDAWDDEKKLELCLDLLATLGATELLNYAARAQRNKDHGRKSLAFITILDPEWNLTFKAGKK